MGVTRMIDLINTFAAQCCMSVGMAGHERVNSYTYNFSTGFLRGKTGWKQKCILMI